MDKDTDARRWPEFHLARYANQVVLFLVAYTLFKWYGEDVGLLGFDSYIAFAAWLIFAVTGNGLTLFAVSRPDRSRYWKPAFATTLVVLALSIAGVIALWDAPLFKERAGLGVAFVLCTHPLNLMTLLQVARLRKRR